MLAPLQTDPNTSVVFLDEYGNPPGESAYFGWAALSFPDPGAMAHALKLDRKRQATWEYNRARANVPCPWTEAFRSSLAQRQSKVWAEVKFNTLIPPVGLIRRWVESFVRHGGTGVVSWLPAAGHDFTASHGSQHHAHYKLAAEVLAEHLATGQRTHIVADDYDEKNGIVWHRDIRDHANLLCRETRVVSVVPTSSEATDLLQLADLLVGAVIRSVTVPFPSVRADGTPKNRKDEVRFIVEDALGVPRGYLHRASGQLTALKHPGF